MRKVFVALVAVTALAGAACSSSGSTRRFDGAGAGATGATSRLRMHGRRTRST